jgi:hypothetical protein
MKLKNKSLVFHYNTIRHGRTTPKLLRIQLSPEFTKIDFGYIAHSIYINGGWIKMAPTTFIENIISKERYLLTKAEGIPLAPIKHNFESKKDWRYFSLYFPPIPQENCAINIIEKVNGTPNDFNYYGIELKLAEGIEIV